MIETIKEYASKRIDLLKLEATEKSSLSAGIITFFVIMIIAFGFFIILFNFGVAFLIGEALNNSAYGFLIVAGFYFLIMIIIYSVRKKIIHSVADNVINFLNK